MRNRTLRLITTSSALLASVSAQPLTAQRAPATAASRTVADSSFAPFWQLLSDSTLERLTSEALGANHDVRAAEARVRGARAARRLTAFDFAPTVTSSTVVGLKVCSSVLTMP